MILIIDFGSQTCHLISRRIKEMGVKNIIVNPEDAIQSVTKIKPSGIIFSGGPSSVYEKNAPTIDKKIFDFKLPILGICYGQQLISYLLKGKVNPGKIKEYGPAFVHVKLTSAGKPLSLLFNNVPNSFQVWMSHGDEVAALPKGFEYIAHSENIKAGAIADEKRKIYAVQFHPEVQHTDYGLEILKNFLNICEEKPESTNIDINGIIKNIKETVGDNKVIMAFSGGTDSFVAGALIAKAIGKNLIPVYVDSGLMRKSAEYHVKELFPKLFGIKPKILDAKKLFLQRLKKVTDPELKRKTIGKLYVELFEKESKKQKNATFLGQGTTYADFIHSKSTKHAALIKSHHNVGGLPKNMKLKLLEPIRYFYTDQVRYIGKKLNLPDSIILQQPFPGPGFAVRILGEITAQRLEKYVIADAIIIDEIEKAGLKYEIFQYFAILTGTNTTAIKGDGRFYGEVVAIRAYTTKDRMTVDWAKIPYKVLQRISARIVNEVPGVSRVVYDITTKPPATMEWE
ncbi:MAG: glutamine-hydrolyzing GMP synthase [bacterium]|nr:glutamine-hydrolyzing GMP synthase [bacterium]